MPKENKKTKHLSKSLKLLVAASAISITTQAIANQDFKLSSKHKERLSKSFKSAIASSTHVLAMSQSQVPVYQVESAEDSTDVILLPGGSPAYIPPHSSHSSRSWR